MSDIRILKLVAKGSADAPQTLMVVGSAVAPNDVWISFDPAQFLQSPFNTWSARAVLVDLPAVTFDEDKGKPDPPFDSELSEGEWMWVARFDLPDQVNLENHWQEFVKRAPSDPKKTMFVRAWQTETVPPWQQPVAKSAARQFVPIGAPVERRFEWKEIESILPFDLGVLLVHGIGKRDVRETLIRFGEPFVIFWEKWLRAVTAHLVAKASSEDRERLFHRLYQGVWRLKQDSDREIRGLKSPSDAVSGADSGPRAPPAKGARNSEDTTAGLACGSVRVEDTIFKPPGSEKPSSTLVRLSVVGHDGEVRESHVLVSEAFWTGETFYPTFSELSLWIRHALPTSLRMHVSTVLRCDKEELRHSIELLHSIDQSNALNWRRLRVTIDVIIRLIKFLVLPLLLVALVSVAQVGLVILLLLSMIPFEFLRGRIGWLINILMGTIGQSYALKTSSVRCNAIVRAVTRDLDYMTKNCQRVAVVSHSQGAELARLVFQGQRWPSVRRWVTFGTGIVPLSMLEEDARNDSEHKQSAWLLVALSVAVTLLGVLWIADAFISGSAPRVQELAGEAQPYVIVGTLWLWIVLAFSLRAPRWRADCSRAMFPRWHDYFASHDPVPGGPLTDTRKQDKPTQDKQTQDKEPQDKEPQDKQPPDKPPPLANESRIYNTRFGLRDHTAYFENVEEFVAPVALDLFGLAGLGHCMNRCAPALNRAAARRDWYTWCRMALRFVTVLLFIGVVAWIARGAGTSWIEYERSAWASTDGWRAFLALWNLEILRRVVFDLWPAWMVAIGYAGLRLVCASMLPTQSVDQLYLDLADVLDRSPPVEKDGVAAQPFGASGPSDRREQIS